MLSEGITNIGLGREKNQDTYLIREEYNLYVVADGMGGHEEGEVASSKAIESIKKVFDENWGKNLSITEVLNLAVKKANQEIYNYSSQMTNNNIMGTTLTAAVIENDIAYIAHVGDSRAYVINDNSIFSVTHDHSYVGELVRNGGLSEEEALTHPNRNVLTRALGVETEVNIDFMEVNLFKNNYLILCTDGLFNTVAEDDMYKTIKNSLDLKEAVEKLIKEALAKGANDNITAVVVKNI